MFKKLFVSVLFLSLLTTISNAQERESLKVDELVFCTAVKERQPVGVDTVFADTVKQVYCFTRITGAADTTSVYHVWYYKGEEKAKVNLSIRSTMWRTWSSKKILKEWDGKWRVDVISSDGNLIRSKEFIIKPTSN